MSLRPPVGRIVSRLHRGYGGQARLRGWGSLDNTYPALTRGANLCRASGAGENAHANERRAEKSPPRGAGRPPHCIMGEAGGEAERFLGPIKSALGMTGLPVAGNRPPRR